jgi:hypothetical protein
LQQPTVRFKSKKMSGRIINPAAHYSVKKLSHQ